MFGRDESGNVTMLFALLLPALMIATGGGIEVSRAVEYKQRLISATDLACRQGQVYVESLPVLSLAPTTYSTTLQNYGTKNLTEKGLTSSATLTVTASLSAGNLTLPAIGIRPGNVHATATGSLDLIFKNFLSKDKFSFTVVRDCSVNANSLSAPPTLLMSESFEAYKPQLKGGWGVFGTMALPNCESSLCQGKSWSTTNAGVEVDDLSAITTGDGVQYGELFAELDSDCGNRVGTTNSNQTVACNKAGQTTNSSIGMTLTLPVGTYEVRYVYNARKNVGNYQYPNDSLICSKATSTDGVQRDTDVAKNGAGVDTISLDGQTRRIELWVEPKTSGYKSDDQGLTVTTNASYMKQYMADVCIWSKVWAERKYRFTVTTQQEYRISWRAGGLDDSFGGLIDYLRICSNSCP